MSKLVFGGSQGTRSGAAAVVGRFLPLCRPRGIAAAVVRRSPPVWCRPLQQPCTSSPFRVPMGLSHRARQRCWYTSHATPNGKARCPRSKAKIEFVHIRTWVIVEYKGKRVEFVVQEGYTFGKLLDDACLHWGLQPPSHLARRTGNRPTLCDEARRVWPASASVAAELLHADPLLLFLTHPQQQSVRFRTFGHDDDDGDDEEGSNDESDLDQDSVSSPVTEREKDMLALRLEAFATNPEVRKELQRAFLCSSPPSLTQDLQVKDNEDGQAESEFASKIAKLLSREKNLNLVFGMFENYIMSEKQLCHLPEHVKSMLFDPQCSNKQCFEELLSLFLDFVREHYYRWSEELKELNDRTMRLALTDLRLPHKWYPVARDLPTGRKIILHIGPTNSGKTYEALLRLKSAKSGLYCGPLRLLAEEVYARMNSQNVPCNLVTGQRLIQSGQACHTSCTVEMADTSQLVDVAVIDEVQMISDRDRGWAWTRAFLGLPAKELHLCGNEAALPLVERICQDTGESLQVKRYKRLSPLKVSEKELGHGSWKRLREGDCVIAFSRDQLHRLKRQIERTTDYRCCIVYGSLPPETRLEQASLFNDPSSEYDILLASDAIGMGLNLNIRRVVFSTLTKFDGQQTRYLTHSEIKQIAGRAGRFNSQYSTGEVTCMNASDMNILRSALDATLDPLSEAGLTPTYEQIVMFSRAHPTYNFPDILDLFTRTASVDSHYFMCGSDDRVAVAALTEKLPLTLRERYKFTISPANSDDPTVMYHLFQFADRHATVGEVAMELNLNMRRLQSLPTRSARLSELETFHRVLELYIWLSYRFETFTGRDRANELKAQTESLIQELLMQPSSGAQQQQKGNERHSFVKFDSKQDKKEYYKLMATRELAHSKKQEKKMKNKKKNKSRQIEHDDSVAAFLEGKHSNWPL